MASFDLRVCISVNEDEAKELLEKYSIKHGRHSSLYAQYSYDGTMVFCEDIESFNKLNEDQEYAEKRIIETTSFM